MACSPGMPTRRSPRRLDWSCFLINRHLMWRRPSATDIVVRAVLPEDIQSPLPIDVRRSGSHLKGSISMQPSIDQIFISHYLDLRDQARKMMAREPLDHTLRATELVNEAFRRLKGSRLVIQDSEHGFRIVLVRMRRILEEHGKRKNRRRRIRETYSLDWIAAMFDMRPGDLERVCLESLAALAKSGPKGKLYAEYARLVYFEGQSKISAAEALGMSERTARNAWGEARCWIATDIHLRLNDDCGSRG